MAFGRGKVILLGEHSVVFGRPALALALGRGVEAEAAQGEAGDRLEVSPWGVTIAPGVDVDEPLAEAFARVLDLHPTRGGAVRVRADVALPGGAGLGCSAAFGVAVIGALDDYYGVTRTPDERAEAAAVWESVFHGNPSGIDAAMAACGGMALYRRGEPLEPVRGRRALPLVVAHSGEPSSTRAMVSQVARLHERAPERIDKTFDAIATLVHNGRLAIEAGDLAQVGQLMDLNQALLNSLLVSTNTLEELCGTAREAGALGAKLTGGGGGGCIIALAADLAAAEAIRVALTGQASEAFVVEAGAAS